MVIQARAEATRRRILDSAVELFDDMGYGETGLADILLRAQVSKGAFYYHFDSKEAVAKAIIEEYRVRNIEAVVKTVDVSAPLLDRVIVATFTSATVLKSDRTCRIGNQLLQALGQVSSVAAPIYHGWTADFTRNLTRGLEEIGVRDGVDAAEVAKATWPGVLGSHLLASALADDPFARLAAGWGFMLRVALPEEKLGHYSELLDRLSTGRQSVSTG